MNGTSCNFKDVIFLS